MDLPSDDILCVVCLFLSLGDFIRLIRVNKRFNRLYYLSNAWKSQYIARWLKGATEAFILDNYDEFDWKSTFKIRYVYFRKLSREILCNERLQQKYDDSFNREILCNERLQQKYDDSFNLKLFDFYVFYNRIHYITSSSKIVKMEEKENEKEKFYIIVVEECKSAISLVDITKGELGYFIQNVLKIFYLFVAYLSDFLPPNKKLKVLYRNEQNIKKLNFPFFYLLAKTQIKQLKVAPDEDIYRLYKESKVNLQNYKKTQPITEPPDLTFDSEMGCLRLFMAERLISQGEYEQAEKYTTKAMLSLDFVVLNIRFDKQKFFIGHFNIAYVSQLKYIIALNLNQTELLKEFKGKTRKHLNKIINSESFDRLKSKHLELPIWNNISKINWFVKMKNKVKENECKQ